MHASFLLTTRGAFITEDSESNSYTGNFQQYFTSAERLPIRAKIEKLLETGRKEPRGSSIISAAASSRLRRMQIPPP